jgi:hypothetical protein
LGVYPKDDPGYNNDVVDRKPAGKNPKPPVESNTWIGKARQRVGPVSTHRPVSVLPPPGGGINPLDPAVGTGRFGPRIWPPAALPGPRIFLSGPRTRVRRPVQGRGEPMKSRSRREPVAQRLLELRARAGSSVARHARYHSLVNRYQRMLLRNYLVRYRHRVRAGWHLWRRLGHRLKRPLDLVRNRYTAARLHLRRKPTHHHHPRPAH